jgi:hypothetical protein
VNVTARKKEQLDTHPAARGLELISRWFPRITSAYGETALRASFLYDALYASINESEVSLGSIENVIGSEC